MAIAGMLRDLFLERRELCPTEARQLLRKEGRKTSYTAIQRVYYDLRQLGLIEFSRSEPGKAPIDRRHHRIIPGKEDDPRWRTNPHHLLYPDSAIGGLNYRQGTSRGRASKYVKGN